MENEHSLEEICCGKVNGRSFFSWRRPHHQMAFFGYVFTIKKEDKLIVVVSCLFS